MKLELYDIGEEWEKEFEDVMQDPYVKKKYNRTKRLREKKKYVNEYLPELKGGSPKSVFDIGPGPGEFLEICRWYKHKIFGVDASVNFCEMGSEYLALSELMTRRQNIPVEYCGIQYYMDYFQSITSPDHLPFDIINCQGAIEQIFKDHLEGPPHIEHHDAHQLSWVVDDSLKEAFSKFFDRLDSILAKDGILLIYGNGAKNPKDYHDLLMKTTKGLGYKNLFNVNHVLHKFIKL